MPDDFRIVPAGDASLVVEFQPRIHPAVNARAIAVARAIRAVRHPGVRDVVTAYRSVAVYFDPVRTDLRALTQEMNARARDTIVHRVEEGPILEIPVYYGSEEGPDLHDVAQLAACTEDEVIARHTSVVYRVYMLGFVPGFAYLGIVDDSIVVPRRQTPRLNVPAGSVAIAGQQTGIYPSETPGGWQLIGRTPIKPFDPNRSEPFLLHPGDRVRFVAAPGPERAQLRRPANAAPRAR